MRLFSDIPVMIDSNVYISLLRGGIDPPQYLEARYGSVNLALCGVVEMEVLRGIRSPKIKEGMREFFSILRWVDTDKRHWLEAADLAWSLDRTGNHIPNQDALIAVSALEIGASVYSFDKHFRGIEGLNVISDPIEG